MQQGTYDYLAQDRIIFGRPAAEAIREEAERLAADRVFLVSSRTLNRETDVVAGIREMLGDRYVGTFDACPAHTPRPSVIAAAAVWAAEPDLIVTLGGGTAIDTVKMVLICLAHDLTRPEELDEYHIKVHPDGSREVPAVAPPPLRQIAVPTTLSGAEFSNIAGCTDPDRGTKHMYTGHEIGARSVILDAAATLHTPMWLWLSTGIRAIDHAVETVCGTNHQPLPDATALHALGMLDRSLRRTKEAPEDCDARLESQMGVWLAAMGLGRVQYGASHGIGHVLGAVAGVPHGHTSCVMLPQVMRYNRPATAERQAMISTALGRPGAEAGDLIAALIERLDQPTRLRDVGVTRAQFDAIAGRAMTNAWVRTNPRPIESPGQVREILEAAW